MANFSALNPQVLTDPRMALANQLLQSGTENTPVRSWTQELARALQGVVGAQMSQKVRDQQMQAYSDLAGIPAQPQSDGGFLGRLFGGGQSSQSNTPPAQSAPPTASTMSIPGGPQGAPQGMPATLIPGGGQPSAQDAPTPSGNAQANPQAPAAPQTVNPGAVAQQLAYAQKMVAAGQKNGNLQLMQQGLSMMAAIREKMAESQIAIGTELGKQGLTYDPVANSVTKIGEYDKNVGATKQAEAEGTALGGLAPVVTAGKVAQENAVNTGTSASAAAKAGASAHATALAENAPDVATAAANKASAVSHAQALATSAPDVATADAYKAQAIAAAQAEVAKATQPAIDAAKTAAVNAINAQKPLTPEQMNQQEQGISKSFMETEAVKRHMEASQAYRNVLAASQGNDKASDIAMIDSLVKMFNPQATVRQATFENFMEHSQGLPSNVVGIVQSFYGNGQHLQPQTRQQLLAQATNYMDSSRQTYNAVKGFVQQQAKTQGLNPDNVVPKFIDPLTAREELARRQAANQQQPQTAPSQAPQ